jgi:hypothetical protein
MPAPEGTAPPLNRTVRHDVDDAPPGLDRRGVAAIQGHPGAEEDGPAQAEPGPGGHAGQSPERLLNGHRHQQGGAHEHGPRQPPPATDGHGHGPDGPGDQCVPAAATGQPLEQGGAAQEGHGRDIRRPGGDLRPASAGHPSGDEQLSRHRGDIGLAGGHAGDRQVQARANRAHHATRVGQLGPAADQPGADGQAAGDEQSVGEGGRVD